MPTIYKPVKPKVKRVWKDKKDNNNYKWVYGTSQWRSLRIQYLMENPLCKICLMKEEPKITSAFEVHHVISLNTESNYFRKRQIGFDPDNLQGLCSECHHELHNIQHSKEKNNLYNND